MNRSHVPIGQTAVLVGYRWAALTGALLGALLANTPMSPPSAVGALGATAMSVTFSVASLRPTVFDWSAPLLLLDLVIGGLCVALTGGVGSSFVLYMTAALLTPALQLQRRTLALLVAAAVWVYAAAVVVDGRLDRMGDVVDDVATLALVPSLVFGTRLIAGEPDQGVRPFSILDPEDREILRRLSQGLTYKEIASETSTSPESVNVSVSRLYRHLGARTRGEALAQARARHLLEPEAQPQAATTDSDVPHRRSQ